MKTAREHIAEESITDQMLDCIPRCRKCGEMLTDAELNPKRCKAVNGHLCTGCERQKYGSSTI